jgi:hypothetical protein
MKLSDIMRNFADLIDANQQQLATDNNTSQNQSVDYEPEDSSDSNLAQQPDDLFIPPLQLKIELLKKATGVESVYDESDELSTIKRNAGIENNPVVLNALGDDEPLDV